MALSALTAAGAIGLVVVSVAIWIRNEKRQDVLFIVGGLFLLVYSIGIKSIIFSALQVVFVVSALAELVKLKDKNSDTLPLN